MSQAEVRTRLFEIAMEVGLLKPEDTDSNIKYSEIVDAVKKNWIRK